MTERLFSAIIFVPLALLKLLRLGNAKKIKLSFGISLDFS